MIDAQLDFYDDPNGSVLKGRIPSLADLPEFVKTAEHLTETELNRLPDSVFALVALDGGHKMRKFACVDKGNTALSVIYFLENKDHLPVEAQKTAAANLVKACGWYNIDPPAALEKIALVGAALGTLQMAQGVAQGHKDFKRRQAAMKAGVPAGQAFKLKEGELTGSSPMPYGIDLPEKQAAVLNPYVDITGKKAPTQVVRETGNRYALIKEGQARYPIDTAEQVQRAVSYFEKFADRFSPYERHFYCMRVSNRADELGLAVPDTMAKYGADTTAPDAGVQLYRRQRLFREGTSEHGLLQEMREKCASMRPGVMAVALEQFDREHGLDRLWDNGLPDPYFSMFGLVKQAEWSFVDGADYINETRLKDLARSIAFRETLEEHFGDEVAQEFSQNPKQIFDSLPLDSKRIIMRLGQQVEE